MKKNLILLFSCLFISILQASPKLFIGIAGATASGKTTFAKRLQEVLGCRCTVIHLDDYYYDLSHVPQEEVKYLNFDHPDAVNMELLYQQLIDLKNNKPIYPPSYDYITHISSFQEKSQDPAEVVVVEGMLLFVWPQIRELFDLRIFIDIDLDVRLFRKIMRDNQERALNFEHIETQYLTTTKPMHQLFVEPSKGYADIIVPHGGNNKVALDLVQTTILSKLSKEGAECQ